MNKYRRKPDYSPRRVLLCMAKSITHHTWGSHVMKYIGGGTATLAGASQTLSIHDAVNI